MRIRKPTNVLELSGALDKNPQRRRPNEPKPNAVLGEPPAHLSDAEAGCWREIEHHAPPGVFGDSDRFSVEMAAVLLNNFRTDGTSMKAAMLTRLATLLQQFGMTPASRSTVMVEKPPSDDPWEKL